MFCAEFSLMCNVRCAVLYDLCCILYSVKRTVYCAQCAVCSMLNCMFRVNPQFAAYGVPNILMIVETTFPTKTLLIYLEE